MKKRSDVKIPWSTLLVASASFLSWMTFAARPSGEWQLAVFGSSVGGCLLLGGLAIQGLRRWRERGFYNLTCCILIVAASQGGQAAGSVVRSLQLAQDIDQYNAAAHWVLTHNNPDNTKRISLPSQYADLGHFVIYERDERCGTRIDFVWGLAFPVKHVIRRFTTGSKWLSVYECRKDWWRIKPIASNWYEMTD